MNQEQLNQYEDIIDLPYEKSTRRAPMPVADRAAQFAPFAALTGYDAAVRETARLTERRIELDEYETEALNRKLLFVKSHLADEPVIYVTYFLPDAKKEGGAYVKKTGTVKKIKTYEGQLVMKDNTVIPLRDILMLESDSFCLINEDL